MKYSRFFSFVTAVFAAFVIVNSPRAEIRVGVLTSDTGPTSLVGIPQKNTVPLLPTEIEGVPIRYISYNDASDPSHTITMVKKLIANDNVDAIIALRRPMQPLPP